MKKALKTRFSGSKNLVRRVLSKSSNTTHEPASENQEVSMNEEAILASEIGALKDQIANLKAAVNALQEETEHKEIAIAKLAREKEKLNLDLLKQKRSNNTLIQQLEDERQFYFQEKEIYCHEMNECKKLKRLMSSPTSVTGEEKSLSEYKNEVFKLKQTLNQTLEANYNLSIKFLRMKNTKTCLKTELKTMKLEHEKLENDYKSKIENLSSELNNLISDKWTTPMSPSSKKYLQLVKQNSCLVYENLCLQLEVDNLNLKFEKLKLERTKSETNSRLKYIHHHMQPEDDENERQHKKKVHKEQKRVRIKEETPEKLEREPKPSCSRHRSPSGNEEIVKIFERVELPGVPDIKIINEKEVRTREKKVKKKPLTTNSKHDNNRSNVKNSSTRKEDVNVLPEYEIKIDDSCRKHLFNKNSSKLALFQVSDMQSITSSDYLSMTPSIKRSYSSPEIVQSSLFQKTSIG